MNNALIDAIAIFTSLLIAIYGAFLASKQAVKVCQKTCKGELTLVAIIVSTIFLSLTCGVVLCNMYTWVDVTDKLCTKYESTQVCIINKREGYSSNHVWEEKTYPKQMKILKRVKIGFGLEYSDDINPILEVLPL